MGINLISGTEIPASVLIFDTYTPIGGSPGTTPLRTVAGAANLPASTALEIQSTLGSLLLPRMTTAQRNLLNDCPGMLIYNNSPGVNTLNLRDANGWVVPAGTGTVTSVDITNSGSGITFTGGPITGSGTLIGELSLNLQNLSDLVSEGIMVKTGVGYTTRAIATANSANIIVSDANGVTGDPTLDLAVKCSTPGSFTQADITVDAFGQITAVASGGGSAGAPANATYITQVPNSFLSNEQALSLLSTGIMKSTTGTGVVSIAVAGTDYYSLDNPTRLLDDGLANGNLFVGKNAGNLTYTSAQFNSGFGINSIHAVSEGVENTFGGYGAGEVLTTGNFNVGFGSRSLAKITTNDSNCAVGYNSLSLLETGDGNVAIGEGAMSAIISADHCFSIGTDSGVEDGLSNAGAIGYNATAFNNDVINIGNGCYIGINNPSAAYSLDVKNVISVAAIAIENSDSTPANPAEGAAIYPVGDILFWKDPNGNVIPVTSLSQFVVSANGTTPYSTIQSAINAAHAAGPSISQTFTVYIKAGTYTENLTLYPYVNLIGPDGAWDDVQTCPVIINGNVTLASSVTNPLNFISNVTIISTTSFAINATVDITAWLLTFNNCTLSTTAASLLSFVLTDSSSSLIKFNNCQLTNSAGNFFTYSGVTSDCAFNYVFDNCYVSMATPQTVLGQNVQYSLTFTNSYVAHFDIDNTESEVVFVAAKFCQNYQGNFSVCTNVTTEFRYTVVAGLMISAGTTATNDFYFESCHFGGGGSSAIVYPADLPIIYLNCTDTNTTGTFNIDKYNRAYSFGEKISTQQIHTTTNATPTVIFSIPIPASMSAWAKISVIGTNSAHTDTTGGTILATIQCTGAAMNVVNQVRQIGASSSADVTLVTNFAGGTLDVTVTGIAATTYYWNSTIEWQKISTAT